jgi:hypothetical protein
MEEPPSNTEDEIKETFIDYNMGYLLDVYDILKERYNVSGLLSHSESSKFIHTIVDSIVFEIIFEKNEDDDVDEFFSS